MSTTMKTPLIEHSTSIDHRKQKFNIWKNVLALVLGVGIFTMGLNPIDDLQSSINGHDGLGVASLGVKYAFMIIGNLFTNTLIIRLLGSKRALVWGTLLYSVYIAANFYPTWSTMIPLTVVAGLGGALMWTTLGYYLASLADKMAYLQGPSSNPGTIKVLFFGVKGMATYAFAALGGLASSIILSDGNKKKAPIMQGICGANYCNEDLSAGLKSPLFSLNNTLETMVSLPKVSSDVDPDSLVRIQVLLGLCMAAALIGVVLMMVCVDPLPNKETDGDGNSVSDSPCSLLFATVRLWKRKELLFLIPITVVYGLQEAFWRVEYTKAYITCSLGMEHIGFLMVCYNIASLVSSLVCGNWFGSQRARPVAFPTMAAVDLAALIAMLFWTPTSDSSDGTLIAYVVTAVTGTTYGALSTLLLAFYGIVFPDELEAAYSNLYFWSFLGSTLMYAFSYSMCLKTKLLIVLIMVAIGLVGYVITELIVRRKLTVNEKVQEIINSKNNNIIITAT